MQLNFLKALALTGGDWVIYGLLLCSILAVAVIIERGILLRREQKDFESLRAALIAGMGGELSAAQTVVERHSGRRRAHDPGGRAPRADSPRGAAFFSSAPCQPSSARR